ncbi:MAG: protein phosphatase CheZ [Desulfovibrio sp.]|nr:protein phosphatase CheZ [Desulfovibrio sp.]
MSENKPENTVYKQVSADIRDGLRDIYQQISTASKDQPQAVEQPKELFLEASSQLTEVLKATETATMHIMEIVERHLELQEQNVELLEKLRNGENIALHTATLIEHNHKLGDDLTALLTTLSFQDITGQRIKRVVSALEQIEAKVVELYVSSGLMMEGAEKDPRKNVAELQSEAKQAMQEFRKGQQVRSELKGPDTHGVSQNAIDDMLSQLGL